MTAELVAALGTADAGAFLAARCVGRHTLHDPRNEHESPAALRARHPAALGVRLGCPCTTSCAELLDKVVRGCAGWGVGGSGRSVELPGLALDLVDAGCCVN